MIRHGIVSIADQIDANITRTAFSPYIYEYKDYAVGLTGPDGELVAQSTGGMPIFVADSVGMAVRDGLAIYGRDGIASRATSSLCNHAAVQGQHLNNTVMYTPIFAGEPERLIGFFAINVHWIDIGGGAVGSLSKNSTDIFMEGLQLRSIKLWSKGERVDDIYRIIENNTRFPDRTDGRHRSAARRLPAGPRSHGRARATSTVSRRSCARVATILDQIARRRRARRSARFPTASTRPSRFSTTTGMATRPIPIHVRVIVAGDEMTVDYSDMPPQVRGSINSGPSRRRPDDGAHRLQVPDRNRRAGERRHVPAAQADPARRQAVSASPTARDGQLLVSVSDDRRHLHQGARDRRCPTP